MSPDQMVHGTHDWHNREPFARLHAKIVEAGRDRAKSPVPAPREVRCLVPLSTVQGIKLCSRSNIFPHHLPALIVKCIQIRAEKQGRCQCLNERCEEVNRRPGQPGQGIELLWELSAQTMQRKEGRINKRRPCGPFFPGVMGMAPAEPGRGTCAAWLASSSLPTVLISARE